MLAQQGEHTLTFEQSGVRILVGTLHNYHKLAFALIGIGRKLHA